MVIEAGDILFLDTNILLTATDEARRHHNEALQLFTATNREGLHLAISGQILREYLVVATRPKESNGFGLEPKHALKNVEEFTRYAVFFEEIERVSLVLKKLIGILELRGTRIHDANVAATMIANGLTKLITENIKDFVDFSDIETADLPAVNRLLGD